MVVTGGVTVVTSGVVPSRHAILVEYSVSLNSDDAKQGTTVSCTVVYVVDTVKGACGVCDTDDKTGDVRCVSDREV